MTFPFGNRAPPTNALVPVYVTTFEYSKVVGLNTPMFDVVTESGIMMTFPFGAKTPPKNFCAPPN